MATSSPSWQDLLRLDISCALAWTFCLLLMLAPVESCQLPGCKWQLLPSYSRRLYGPAGDFARDRDNGLLQKEGVGSCRGTHPAYFASWFSRAAAASVSLRSQEQLL